MKLWGQLSWAAATMIVCYVLLLVIGLVLMIPKRPKRPTVIRRINQFRDG